MTEQQGWLILGVLFWILGTLQRDSHALCIADFVVGTGFWWWGCSFWVRS